MVSLERAKPRTRPANRKAHIAAVAADRFCERGYHPVSIEDIAAAVGVTSRAIYRHYDNKADLLSNVVLASVSRAEGAVGVAAEGDDPTTALHTLAFALASALERNDGVLLEREVRHLDATAAAMVESRLGALRAKAAGVIRSARPELAHADAVLLTRAVLAVVCSPSSHSSVVGDSAALLAEMATAVLTSRAVPSSGSLTTERVGAYATTRAARREAVLHAAIELFAQRGYSAVRMEDIGAAAGIAGPSIYEHFDGKPAVLLESLTRGSMWLQVALAGALSAGTRAGETLTRVLRSYIDCVVEQADLIAVLLTETVHLPEQERHEVRRMQHDYVAEWVHLLVQARPSMSAPEARFRVHAALNIVNDHARGGRQPRRSDLRDVLTQLGREVMGL